MSVAAAATAFITGADGFVGRALIKVLHLPSYLRCKSGVNLARITSLARMRVAADALLLDALTSCAVRRIVYVADACCYGPTGPRPITEDAPPRNSRCGRSLMPALDRLDGYIVSGLPIVTALPGLVYFTGGWFRRQVIEPVIRADQIFSNIRLRGTGFQFEHPTLEHGLQQIVGALHE